MSIIPATDAQSKQGSEEDATHVLELTLWHQMSIFSAHEFVQLGSNSRTIAAWISNNRLPLAAARRKDVTRDWYFPILFQKFMKKTDDSLFSWSLSWSGIHHQSGEIQPLFSLTHLPREWIREICVPRQDVIASSGGLLLITTHQSREIREPPNALFELMHQKFPTRFTVATTSSQSWKPLLVSNPLTREWRELPAADSRDVGLSWWDYSGLHAHIIADDEANNYKVILALRRCVCVYKSTSNTWTCKAFPERGPWGFQCASACVGGRLYLADLDASGNISPVTTDDFHIRERGYVRVFEIDEDAGIWKPPVCYALRNYLRPDADRDYGFRMGSYALKILECNGGMYAIIPTKLDILLAMEETMRLGGFQDLAMLTVEGIMPLQFCILKLQGEAGLRTRGILRIHIPGTEDDCVERKLSLLEKVNRKPYLIRDSSWFRCTGRGTVIWVTLDDYLLQYDVVSGQSTTRILPNTMFADAPEFPYRPSFHMKP